jgi:DNA modification methylase
MTVQILQGDARTMLRTLPDDSVHCVVTSPPYWGLRDYGVAGQMGMEPTYQEHIAALVDLFREVRRVMRPDATLWLNYGDCYATTPNGRSALDVKKAGGDNRTFRDKPFSTIGGALKPKDLCMLPFRLAIALQEDGWWVRQDIIWHKPNPMPESIKDRCTKAHEYIFLLSKSSKYYFDADSIKEAAIGGASGAAATFKRPASKRAQSIPNQAHGTHRPDRDGTSYNGDLRSRRSVWTVATQPFLDAHFATFPPALIEPCIKAGCPAGGTVLDPFGGAGTTGLVADRLGRNAILIELNPEYAAQAAQRITNDSPLFTEVA